MEGARVTFDFAPGFINGPAADSGTPARNAAPSPLVPSPCAPASPSMVQVAVLVEELFAEGSLSFEQLRSLSGVPELTPLLGDALAGVSPERRKHR
jgi:hypothetical protein